MLIRNLVKTITRENPFLRAIHSSVTARGLDSREYRKGHLRKKDDVEGEKFGSISVQDELPYEYLDENTMERLFDNKKFKDIPVIHINCTRNNTKVTLRDHTGAIMIKKTAGEEGYLNCRKGTTVAAQAVANRVVSYANDNEINMARLVFNGLGPGRGAAYKVIELSGIKIISLSDRTEAIEPWTRRPRKAKRL